MTLRAPDRLVNPQFWAEDGIFYSQAWHLGPTCLFTPLAGYLQLAPRLVAAVAGTFSPVSAPLLFALLATAMMLYVLALTCSPRCPLPWPAALIVGVVLSPNADEILFRNGNAQWGLGLGLILILLSSDPTSRRQWIHDTVATTIIGLSGPFVVVLSPLFAGRALHRRSRASWMLAAIVLACALGQSVVILTHPEPAGPAAHIAWRSLAEFPGLRIGGALLGGLQWWKQPPEAVAIGWTVLTALLLGWAALAPGPLRWERQQVAIAIVLLVTASAFRCRASFPSLCVAPNGDRYFFIPGILLMWLMIVRASTAARAVATIARVGLALVAVNAVPRFHCAPLPDRHWREQAQVLRDGHDITVTINPDWSFSFRARKG